MHIALLLSFMTYVSSALPENVHEYFSHDVSSSFRIVGGKPAKIGEFRGQVSLQNRFHTHICAGILIDPKHVVTAAHCYRSEKRIGYIMGDDLWVTVKGSKTRQIRRIMNFVPHPEFIPFDNRNDIAVIRVDEPFEESNRFGAMRRADFTPPDGTHCTVVGWGYTTDEEEYGELSWKLLKTDVDIINIDFCNGSFSYDGNMQPGMLCAGKTRGGGHDSCEGDSGGLLTCGGMRMLNGVVSFGYSCGLPAFPGIYTDVSKYNDWIDEIINSKELPYYEFSPFPRPSGAQPNSSHRNMFLINTIIFMVVSHTNIIF